MSGFDKRSADLTPGDWVLARTGEPAEVRGVFVVLQLSNGHDERHEVNGMTTYVEPPVPEGVQPPQD